jgi:hypothetical protein
MMYYLLNLMRSDVVAENTCRILTVQLTLAVKI